ncbi:MAG: WXG100 family type VII secretion target [Coprobacillaceae bacterium]
MNGINANWDVLLEAARGLTRNGEALNDIVNTINGDIISTQDAWQGQASQAYQEQWVTILPQFLQAAENIVIMGTQINNYVSAQQQLEDEAKNTYTG